jgi:heptosyltransferase-2
MDVDRIPRLRLRPSIEEMASVLLQDLGVGGGKRLIGVHAGASYGETKRWFPERYAAVLERLQDSKRLFVLFGGPAEEQVGEVIGRKLPDCCINLAGKTTIAEATALISRCDLFLSNDSGLMHVAAALGVSQVAIFGSSDPQKTAPLNDRAVVLYPTQVECTPCFRSQCPRDLECLKAISVEEVYAVAERLLAAASP